jgi:hypothetical protein
LVGFAEIQVFEMGFLEIELQVAATAFTTTGATEIIEEELVIPGRIRSFEIYHCIFKAYIIEADLLFQEKPIGDIYFGRARI